MLVQSIPYPAGGGAPPGDVVFAANDFETGTATGAQSFTSPTISGVTPKGVMVFWPTQKVSEEPGESPVMNCGISFIQGTNDMFGVAFSRDNVASPESVRMYHNNKAINAFNISGSTVKQATGQTASGGVELNFSQNTDVSYRWAFTAFAGADTSCFVGSLDLGTGTSAIDITAPAFTPDVILTILTGNTGSNALNGDLYFSFGIVTNEGGTYAQRCFAWSEDDNAADPNPKMSISTNRGAAKIADTDGVKLYDLLFNNFDANGFDITPSASAGGDDLFYMAIKFNGRSHKLVAFDTPTGTGTFDISGAGFTPSYALLIMTNLEVVDDFSSRAASNAQGGFSICSICADEQWSASHRIEATGAANSNTGNQLASGVIAPSATDCDAFAATFTQFTNDGVRLNVIATQGTAKKCFALLVQ